jgi:hypothetical protein
MKTTQQHPQPIEDDYWAVDQLLRIASVELGKASDPAVRARLLLKLAGAQQHQADIHTAVFGPDPLDDPEHEGVCVDLADSHAFSAMLYGLLADVERTVAFPILGRRRNTDTRLEAVAGPVLDRMADTPNLDARMRMLDGLIDAVKPIVGGQAAESLWCLPAPGFSGPLTLKEKDEWLAGLDGSGGLDVISFSRRMDTIGPRIVFAAVVIAAILGAALSIAGAVRGSWLDVAVGASLAVAVPVVYIRRLRSRWAYLAEPTAYDYEGLPVD